MNSEYSFSNSNKAKIALQAIEGRSYSELSGEYDISEKEIKQWVDKLKNRAEVIFQEDKKQDGFSDSAKEKQVIAEEIRDNVSLLKATFEAIPGGVMIVDLEGNIIAYNRKCREMWGIPKEVIANGTVEGIIDFVKKELKEPEKFQHRVKELHENPDTKARDIIEFNDGRVFERCSMPHRTGGKIVARVTSFVDISEQEKAKEKAHRFGNLLDSITTNVNEGILRSTPEEGLIYVNDAFVSMFGYDSREEVMQLDPEEFYADKRRRRVLLKDLDDSKQMKNEEILFKRKDGSTFWGLENGILIENNGNKYIDAVITDISERKKAEEALRESEEKYRNILKNIEDGYFETDLEGNLTFFNRSLVNMLKYTPSEMKGMNNREYMDKENAARVYESFNKVYRTGNPQHGFDWELIRKDGSRIIVEASVNLIESEDGDPLGFRGIVRDVTERKKTERQIKSSLKEKEVLLGEIHHRVKNNLAVISGLLYLQAEKTEEKSAQDLLRQSQSRINSMGIIHELLYENQTFASVDPGKYIEQLTERITRNLNIGDKNIHTTIETEDLKLDMTVAIPCALIINELLTNAYKYAFEGRDSGTINIKLNRTNGTCRLTVADDGVGIPENYSDKFEQNGLGLFLVKTLTEQINGQLDIQKNRGTQFEITFPAD